MLYIHKLADFHRKTADVESVYIVRELKQKMKLPLTELQLNESFADFFISDLDKEAMEAALNLVPVTIEKVKNLLQRDDPLHEKVNLFRTLQILEAIPEPLFNNIVYTMDILDWQKQFLGEASIVLNAMPKMTRSREDQKACNDRLGALFQKILRNDGLLFNSNGVIHEKHLSEMTGLLEGMAKGYFFHVTLEEELQKQDFSRIKTRIPSAEMQLVLDIENDLNLIMKGVKRAYDSNMRMVNCALMLYSYMKWMMNP